MPRTRLAIVFIFIILLIGTRFYNLETTARLTEDESGFLVRLHQIYVDKKLTLVGPINEQGTKVFGSLTLYMLLPFTILGNFDPLSMFEGAAFWGVLTGLLLLYLGYKTNKDILLPMSLLILFWYPVMEMGRWAWNPNFIPFWIALGILINRKSGLLFKLVSGTILGLSVHNHYYSIFAITAYALLFPFPNYSRKSILSIFALLCGIAVALAPFVIFDLRHPPGIFLSGAKQQAGSTDVTTIVSQASYRFFENMNLFLIHYTQSIYLKYSLIVGLLALLLYDLRQRSKSLVYGCVFFCQVIIVSFINQVFPHYLIPGLVFFYLWIIYPRKGTSKLISYLNITIIVLAGLLSIRSLIFTTPITPSLKDIRSITNFIDKEIQSEDLKNVNIAVLGSSDQNTYGRRYRDLLLVKSNRTILSKYEYGVTDNLFIVSTSSEEELRHDPAYEIQNFRHGNVISNFETLNSNWKVYYFTKNP